MIEIKTPTTTEVLKHLPYPRANFVTHPDSQGFPLGVEICAAIDPRIFKLTFRRGSEDYFVTPHVYVPSLNLWVSDHHRYLPVMVSLGRSLGAEPRRVLSIDADYFSRFPDAGLGEEVDRLMASALRADPNYDLVVADMHEDFNERAMLSGEICGVSGNGRHGSLVEAVDSGVISDDNFIGFMGRKTLIVKPPMTEFYPTLGKGDRVTVVNSGQLVNKQGDVSRSILEAYDMVHFCTSPVYVSPVRAFQVLTKLQDHLISSCDSNN